MVFASCVANFLNLLFGYIKAFLIPTLPFQKNVVATDALFAVFDGHNGAECASYACIHFPICLVEVPDFGTKPMKDIMSEAFASLNQRLEVRLRNEVN